jgi:hypothetical protein
MRNCLGRLLNPYRYSLKNLPIKITTWRDPCFAFWRTMSNCPATSSWRISWCANRTGSIWRWFKTMMKRYINCAFHYRTRRAQWVRWRTSLTSWRKTLTAPPAGSTSCTTMKSTNSRPCLIASQSKTRSWGSSTLSKRKNWINWRQCWRGMTKSWKRGKIGRSCEKEYLLSPLASSQRPKSRLATNWRRN